MDGVAGGFTIGCVAGVLRVVPKALRDAALAQTEVATFISTMAVHESMSSAGEGVSGLHSESGCRLVGELFNAAATAAHEELASHAGKLSTAADKYQRADKEIGERLHRLIR
ncbi:hypothetical protein A7G45_06025 [Mycolicibacterium llatzerense]|nr:hypothetical protein [Mycolicibacterium llatzerense]